MSGGFFGAFRCCKGDIDTIQTGAEGKKMSFFFFFFLNSKRMDITKFISMITTIFFLQLVKIVNFVLQPSC